MLAGLFSLLLIRPEFDISQFHRQFGTIRSLYPDRISPNRIITGELANSGIVNFNYTFTNYQVTI